MNARLQPLAVGAGSEGHPCRGGLFRLKVERLSDSRAGVEYCSTFASSVHRSARPPIFDELAVWSASAGDVAKIGFVGFDNRTFAAHWCNKAASAHCFTDAMRQEPCSFIGYAQGAVQLMRANALLGRRHEVESLKPDMQFDMAGLHDALGRHAEVLAAVLLAATIDTGLLGSERIERTAMRANPFIAPAKRLKIFAGGFRGLEMFGVELGHDGNPVSIARS